QFGRLRGGHEGAWRSDPFRQLGMDRLHLAQLVEARVEDLLLRVEAEPQPPLVDEREEVAALRERDARRVREQVRCGVGGEAASAVWRTRRLVWPFVASARAARCVPSPANADSACSPAGRVGSLACSMNAGSTRRTSATIASTSARASAAVLLASHMRT